MAIETKGHKDTQPGLRGHSHDPAEDLMKQYVVAKVLPTGGRLWLKSFDTMRAAELYSFWKTPTGERHVIIDQFQK